MTMQAVKPTLKAKAFSGSDKLAGLEQSPVTMTSQTSHIWTMSAQISFLAVN